MSRKNISRWIYLSITYPDQEWPILLQKAVIPFLESSYPEYLLKNILHFGKYRGDYIGLSCEVRIESCRSFLESVEKYFSDFFQNFPGKDSIRDDSCRTESLFMDFPSNLVYHSLHKFLPTIQGDKEAEYIKVWHDSSVFLMDIFGSGPFDKEDFFTTALYLNLLLLLSSKKSAERVIQRRAAFAEEISAIREYREQFDEAEPTLREVWQDCENIINGLVRKDLEPIAGWFHVFNDFLQPMDKEIELQSFFLEDILICIRTQLCIVSNGKSLIDFFIDRLLQPDFIIPLTKMAP